MDQRLRMRSRAMDWALAVARGRAFVIGNTLVGLALLVVIGLFAAPYLPSTLSPAGRSAVTITGPGVQTPASVAAYILGAVRTPGVYALANGSRVAALVTLAGGALADADLARVDLAARVNDGQEIYVPHVGETVPLTLGGKVNINAASADDLHNALGISRTIAKRIVTYRAAHGPFNAVSQLLLVPVSQTTYDKIKDLVTV